MGGLSFTEEKGWMMEREEVRASDWEERREGMQSRCYINK